MIYLSRARKDQLLSLCGIGPFIDPPKGSIYADPKVAAFAGHMARRIKIIVGELPEETK